jgi:hypothetical protein
VAATFALHNFEFVLHGYVLEFGRFTDLRIVSEALRCHARERGHPVKRVLLGSRLRGNDGIAPGMMEMLNEGVVEFADRSKQRTLHCGAGHGDFVLVH